MIKIDFINGSKYLNSIKIKKLKRSFLILSNYISFQSRTFFNFFFQNVFFKMFFFNFLFEIQKCVLKLFFKILFLFLNF